MYGHGRGAISKNNSKLGSTEEKKRETECWMDGVKRSIIRCGLTEEDITDRDLWRQEIVGVRGNHCNWKTP